jgi:hypothetical protein
MNGGASVCCGLGRAATKNGKRSRCAKRESASTGNKKVFGGRVLNRVPLFLFTARFWALNSETDTIAG